MVVLALKLGLLLLSECGTSAVEPEPTLVSQVGWSTARNYYTFLWSPLPDTYEEGTAVNRAVVFQGKRSNHIFRHLNHVGLPLVSALLRAVKGILIAKLRTPIKYETVAIGLSAGVNKAVFVKSLFSVLNRGYALSTSASWSG